MFLKKDCASLLCLHLCNVFATLYAFHCAFHNKAKQGWHKEERQMKPGVFSSHISN